MAICVSSNSAGSASASFRWPARSPAKKHVKPNPAKGIKGGIAEREATINASNVMIVTADGKTSRIGVRMETVGGKTRRTRVAVKTGESLDSK